MEKIKNKYYDSCRLVNEQEKNVCKTFSAKMNSSDEEINKAHDNLLKYRSQAENHAQQYKSEIFKVNKILEDNEKRYKLVMEKFSCNEESRIFFVKCNMEKFSKVYEEFTIISFDFLNKLNNTLVEIKIDEDIKFFNEKFRPKEKESRLIKEEFVSYEVYKKSMEIQFIKDSLGSDLIINENYITSSGKPSSRKSSENNKTNEAEDYEILNETHGYSEKYQLVLVEGFIKQLLGQQEIEVDSMARVMDVLYNNPLFYTIFIDFVLKDKKNLFIKFSNYHNLQHFANILNTISLNLDNVENENYDLNFAIIFISERTFYQNGDDKIYLCALLSRNKLYANRSFWLDLIELKLARRIEEQLNRTEKTNHTRMSDKDLFSNIGSKFKNLFNKEKDHRTSRLIKNYELLPQSKKVNIDKLATTELSSIIKEFIPHFANFSFEITEAIDMIIELSTKYKIPKEKISYYVTMLNSSVFTIKTKLPNQTVKSKKTTLNLAKSNDYKLLLISNAFNYLRVQDALNIMPVSKSCYRSISRKIYKKILMSKNDIPLNVRLGIWKSILRIVNYY